jgi:hypothetical protein
LVCPIRSGLPGWEAGSETEAGRKPVIRQARTYLVGAVSGTALIGAAVVAFVVLVSLQALRDWPISGLGIGGTGGSIAAGRPAAQGTGASRGAGRTGGTARRGVGAAGHGAGDGGSGKPSASPAPGPPAGSGQGFGSGGSGGSAAGGGGSGSPGGGGGGGGPSLSGKVTGTVDETVSGVDEATGGALGGSGVTQTTEGAVNGAAGPGSTAGGTIDKGVEAVGGLPE